MCSRAALNSSWSGSGECDGVGGRGEEKEEEEEEEEIMNAVARTLCQLSLSLSLSLRAHRLNARAVCTCRCAYVCTRTHNGRESRNFFIITGGGTNTGASGSGFCLKLVLSSLASRSPPSQRRNLRVQTGHNAELCAFSCPFRSFLFFLLSFHQPAPHPFLSLRGQRTPPPSLFTFQS